MKLRHYLFLAVLAIVGILFARAFTAGPGIDWGSMFLGALVLFTAGNLLAKPSGRLCVTLTVSEILTDILKAFTTRVPALKFFATDFSNAEAKYGQTIIAHLPTVPTVYDHTAAVGYSQNAQSARDLLVDVPVVMDGWKDVPIKILPADASQDRSQNYLKTIGNAGYALAKAVVDYALTKAVIANFSNQTIEANVNVSKDTLSTVRLGMNGVKAGAPRYMLCSSAFFGGLDSDARITSNTSYNQRVGAEPYGHLINIEGFTDVLEYPDFPANAQNLSAFGFDERAIGIATRLPQDSTNLAQQMGIPVTYKMEIIQDPMSGLTMVGFAWIDPNTHIIYVVVSVMFGAVAGSQGGAAGVKTDYAGWRVVTQ